MKNFGRNPILSIGGVLLAALWLFAADARATQGVAEVKKVVGTANFTDAKGGGPIKEGDILMEGATITTGAGSYVDLDLKVNGNALRVEADSTLALNKLNYTQAGEAIVNTQVEVKKGSAVSNVITKLSKASKFEIKTPSGVAGIRGTVTRATTTRVTCLIGTISFVPLAGGGVAIIINGGSTLSAGSLAAVKTGAAETRNLAQTATQVTANTAANMVQSQVQLFTSALAADAATEAGKAGGNTAKAAADTAKAAVAELLAALQQAAADASPEVKAAIQAVATTLNQNSESVAANAAAAGAGVAVKINGGSNAEAQAAAQAAAGQTTNNAQIAGNATSNANGAIQGTGAGGNPTGSIPTVSNPGTTTPAPTVTPPTVIFVSPDTAGSTPTTKN